MDPTYWPRALLLATTSVFNTTVALYEHHLFRQELNDIQVPPPLFVLGHYRSGTTYLQNLLSLDKALAYPNLYQAFFPKTFICTEKFLAPLVGLSLIRHRFQDGVSVSVNSPMEDEIALCVWTGLSPHMSWALPSRAAHYDRFLTFENATTKELECWKSALFAFVTKLTLISRLPLVLKSPPHTARIKLILEIFPNARFVHIHRDPFAVFSSTLHMLERIYPYWNLEPPREHGTVEARIERVVTTYRMMYEAFFEQRQMIPAGNYCELGYELLETDPEGSLRRIYAALELHGIEELCVAVRGYLKANSQYRKNRHVPIESSLRQRLVEVWERSFREWGYSHSDQLEGQWS